MSDLQTPEFYEFPAALRVADIETAVSHPALAGIENPFIRQAEISSERLDSYFTRMDAETTLRNYALDAAAGVTVLDSHDARKLGVGYSFTGELSRGNDGVVTVLSDFYMVRGLEFGGQHSYRSTDDYIKAIEAGLIRKVSVGFHGYRQVCDICGENYYSWDCPHIGGVDYPIGDQGRETVTATSTIYDARLSEYSLVYAGATPGAQLRKIEHAIKEGLLTGENIAMLEQRYRVRLPEKPKQFVVNGRADAQVDENKGGNEAVDNHNREMIGMDFEQQVEKIRAILAETAAPEGELPDQVRWLIDEAARLRPLADAGRQYRSDLIEQALGEGVRALGDDFALESYRGLLEASGLDVIKRMRDDWARIAGKQFPGGRQTVDEDEGAPEPKRQPSLVPDEAYG